MSASTDDQPLAAAQNLALETAIRLASAGYPVLPVFPDRSAALPNWPNKATTDLDQIKRWLESGRYYLVGMLTGPRSGVDVLDVDPRNGGDNWLAENAHLIPETRRQTTRRGGQHYFLQAPAGVEVLRKSDCTWRRYPCRGRICRSLDMRRASISRGRYRRLAS